MSFLKRFVKNVNKLYYGEIKPTSVTNKVDNFADYLGDMKYREKDDQSQEPNNTSQDQQDNTNSNEEYIQPEEPKQNPKVASVPFMITRQMKLDLMELGYGLNDIKKLTPAEANYLLQENIKNKKE